MEMNFIIGIAAVFIAFLTLRYIKNRDKIVDAKENWEKAQVSLEANAREVYGTLFPHLFKKTEEQKGHAKFPFCAHIATFPKGNNSNLHRALIKLETYDARRKVRENMKEFVDTLKNAPTSANGGEIVKQDSTDWRTFEKVCDRFNEILKNFKEWKKENRR